MAMFTVLRRATAAVVPLAACRSAASSSSRTFHSALSVKLLLHKETTPFVPSRSFSNAVAKKTVEDDNLVQLIQTEIDRALKDHAEFEIPQDFPFQIEYFYNEHLYLKRQYEDETIYVRVRVSCGELFVTVVKANGMCLEFDVDTYPDNKIGIFKLFSIKFDESEAYVGLGPYNYFNFLDQDLQKAFLNYLEIRGIPSIYNVVQEYMPNKEKKDELVWLQNLKSFVEK